MNNVTERLSSALADRYRIERHIGAGGMATVYLAQDLKHDRKVALKVLKPELAAVLGAERFVVEIKTTAALQHPHILPLFDSGTADGFLYYVMPFIEGETLRDKLNRETQFSVDEAVRITSEVADALDYAHRHGVIHRDIKPENILLHDGRPMVADFGIALAVSAAAGGRMTETGLSLGTPHYMSPEQATAEKEITGRSDVYSLASMLYEMLAGQPPHLGGSAQQIIMKIIAEPVAAVTQFRKAVPPHVAAAVAKALEKLPADRFDTAKAFRDALATPGFTHGTLTDAQASGRGGGVNWKDRSAIPLVAALAVAAIAALWGWMRPAPPPLAAHLAIDLPDSAQIVGQPGTVIALSGDGSRIVYVGPGGGDVDLWERSIGSSVVAPLPETNGADSPFLSADGSEVAFYRANPPRLFSVSLRGGPRQVWVEDSTIARGGDFAPDGSLFFIRTGGIRRVREPGGPIEAVTVVDAERGERAHAWVDVLPDGRSAIFTILRDRADQYDIAAVDLRSGDVKVLLRGVFARYSPTGHLLYVNAAGGLFTIPYDASGRETRGVATPLVSGVGRGDDGVAHMAVSDNGLLLYTSGAGTPEEELVWVDRQGGVVIVDTLLRGPFEEIALSPDGKRLAVTNYGATDGHIWVKDLPDGPQQKLTIEGDNYGPWWSVDGRSVTFASRREPGRTVAVYRKRVDDGSNPVALMAPITGALGSAQVTRDGQWAVYAADFDIWAFRIGADSVGRRILATPAIEVAPTVSPDGRWIAYLSTESGVPEVYVSPFPEMSSSRTIVSLNGGSEPHWSPTGRELFYVGPNLELRAAQVEMSPTFRVRDRTTLFSRSSFGRLQGSGRAYAPSPDGRRFLMYRRRSIRRESVRLVTDWPQTLMRAESR